MLVDVWAFRSGFFFSPLPLILESERDFCSGKRIATHSLRRGRNGDGG